jgi:hypothetical protein
MILVPKIRGLKPFWVFFFDSHWSSMGRSILRGSPQNMGNTQRVFRKGWIWRHGTSWNQNSQNPSAEHGFIDVYLCYLMFFVVDVYNINNWLWCYLLLMFINNSGFMLFVLVQLWIGGMVRIWLGLISFDESFKVDCLGVPDLSVVEGNWPISKWKGRVQQNFRQSITILHFSRHTLWLFKIAMV